MAGLSAAQIYSMLAERAEGKKALDAGFGVSWHARDSLADRAVQLIRLSAEIEQSWTGDAAGGASRGLGPITWDLDAAAADHNTTQDLMNRQMNDFSTARNSVVPVPAQPQIQDPAATMANGESPTAIQAALRKQAMETQTDQRNAAAENNVRAYNTYHGASGDNTSTIPQSTSSLEMDKSPMQAANQAGHGGPGGGTGSAGSAPYSGGAGAGAGGANVPVASPVQSKSHGQAGGPSRGGDQHSGSGGYTSPKRPVAGSETGAAAANPGTTVPGPGTRAGYVPPAGGQGDGSTTRSPGFTGAGGGLTADGTGSGGAGRAGAAGRISEVLGGRGGSGAGGGAGGRGGAMGAGSAGAQAAAAAAGEGGASRGGGSGRGGPAGAVPPGGGVGRGGEDQERKRKYGQKPKPEELTGTSEEASFTDVPVLGETRQPGESKP